MNNNDLIQKNENDDGIDRAGFIKCMAWAGTGVLWLMSGGSLKAFGMSQLIDKSTGQLKNNISMPKGDLSFVQISDSHIGFSKPANPDVTETLRATISKINALPKLPSFVLHTGDLTHLAQDDEFDALDQELKSIKTGKIFYVPGEHDVLNNNGKAYLQRFGKDTRGDGWYSFDYNGVHFVGLVNVVNMAEGGLGVLGNDQLDWLKKDLSGLSDSTPIVVFAHIPLWAVYPEWGWGTRDSETALSYLKRFGSVSVLNGHIHQTMLKVEGNITFHSATSTAFPQPAPGAAAAPGPLKVPAEKLKGLLGLTSVDYVEHNHTLAITDMPLEGEAKKESKEG
jgi:3',5'-cyclic AMP phosphodiesterase CpdA